jgi:DNA-binding CsgD family transcriptional regulator/predicted XRE-type DNA-binding protein
MSKAARVPELPKGAEALRLSKQQGEICRMALVEHLDAVEMARRLDVSPKCVRNQIGRIWLKAENKTNKNVNTFPPRAICNQIASQELPDSGALRERFATQVKRIIYLKQLNLKNRYIAEILGIRESNVRQVLSRARAQKTSLSFVEPVPVDPVCRRKNVADEAAVRDGARMFYNKFVTGRNKAPAREVYRGLALLNQGGAEARKTVFGDRARIVTLLAELSRCDGDKSRIVHVDVDDKTTRRLCGKVLREHFSQIMPGHYKPKDSLGISLLRSAPQGHALQTSGVQTST